MQKISSLQKKITDLLSASHLALPMLLASVVGVGTGFVIVVFIKAIDLSQRLFFQQGQDWLSFLSHYSVLVIPTMGGLLVGIITFFIAPDAKGHGVPEVMKSIALKKSKIPAVVIFAKPLASAISIGSGASIGREGPAAQIGAAFGSASGFSEL
jgi:CIC family chloride channel protein